MKKQQHLENYWNLIFVPVKIRDALGEIASLNFLLDRGCEKTQKSHEAASGLGYAAIHGTEPATVTSIAGEIHGYKLNLAQFTVFNKSFRNYEIDVFDIAITETDDQEIDGLIGMDIISRYKLLIDGPKQQVKVFR